MKLEFVYNTIRKDIKSSILMHTLIFDISFLEKLETVSYFKWFLQNISRFTQTLPNAPTARVLNGSFWSIFYWFSHKYTPSQSLQKGKRYMAD